MKNLTIAAAILIIMGCSPFRNFSEKDTAWKSYELEQRIEKNTGAVMVDITLRKYYPSYTPLFIQESPLGTIVPGQTWTAFHVLDKDENQYILTSDQLDTDNMGIIVSPNGEIIDEQPIINMKRASFISERFKRMPFENLKDKKLFIRLRDGSRSEDIENGPKGQLIYGGVTNNTIVVNYREFIDNIARPAFYQELKYDLSKDDIIVFRSLKMKILEATNSKISFKVIEDGDLPWW
jgi:hypothetical protein